MRWDGEEIAVGRRRAIGYMPEERGLYPKMRIGDQLSLGNQQRVQLAAALVH